jgi:hypothetical protein
VVSDYTDWKTQLTDLENKLSKLNWKSMTRVGKNTILSKNTQPVNKLPWKIW